MSVVQSTYSQTIADAVAGMPADADYSADSRICETAAGIAFGVAVSQGSVSAKGALIGGASAAVFVGVTIRDKTLLIASGETVDKYQDNDVMGVMYRGDIWVTVGGDVVAGGDVTFAAATGVLSSASAGGAQFAVSGARWMTSASSGGLAILRLSGSLPSA